MFRFDRCLIVLAFGGVVGCTAETGSPLSGSLEGGDDLSAFESAASAGAKADTPDPRDMYPDLFAFTAAPGDVDVLPGEFERTDTMIVGWAGQHEWEASLVNAAASYVPVSIVTTQGWVREIRRMLNDRGMDDTTIDSRVTFITENELGENVLQSVWMRDYGPLVPRTTDGGRRVIDFRYHFDRLLDDALPTRLANHWRLPISRPQLVLEGGNVQSNGSGVCVVTDRAVSANRWAYSADETYVKDTLRDYLGCTTTVIVPRLEREGTGHVDMFVHIVSRDRAIVGEYLDTEDAANKVVTDDAARRLENEGGFTVTRIPMPRNDDGIFRSYTNALAVNDGVLVPVYSDATDHEREALDVFGNAYPERTVVPLDAAGIIQRGGAIHCTTMSLGAR